MKFKKVLALLSVALLLVSSFHAGATSYQHGDKTTVTVSEVWAFHGGRQPGEDHSTSNGGNRNNHYNNRLYWFEGYSIDLLQTKDLQAAQYNGLTYFYCIHKWQAYNDTERQFYTGEEGNLLESLYWISLGKEKQELLQRLSIYGFPAQTPQALGVSAVDDAYAATQAIAWEIVTGRRTLDGFTANYKSSGNEDTPKVAAAVDNARYFYDNYMHYAYDGNGHYVGEATPALTAYNKIWSDMAQHDVLASFHRQTLSLTWDAAAKAYTGSVTDANGILANSSLISSLPSGVTCSFSGNTVTFTATAEIQNPITITFQKNLSSMPDTTPFAVLEATSGGGQEMMSGVMDDPRGFVLNVLTDTGTLRLMKTSEDGKVGNVPFRIVGQGIDQTVRTEADGSFKLNLAAGDYDITEMTGDPYQPQESRRVTVVSGQTAIVTFNNTLKRGDLTVTKTAEDGLNEGVKFRLYGTSLSGLSVNEYAVTDSTGKAYFRDVLISGVDPYVLEEMDTANRYVVPEKQTAVIEWNKVTNKSFNNTLKRGNLIVTKTAEDGLCEGIKFHLTGTSLSGLAVDEYAVTGSDGKAYFRDVLISGAEPYVLEELETANRYVVPLRQTAVIEWNKVTNKSFNNTLKKWRLTVTKSDKETRTAQGGASLGGAVYGIYKGEQLIDTYTTDQGGQFTTKYYICGDDWSLQEITPSEGYLLDETVHHIGAEAKHYTAEYTSTTLGVVETVKKGKIAILKHSDDGSTQIETPEAGAKFEVFLKAAGSYTAAKETERDILVCDAFGFDETKPLPYGVYTVKQTKGWAGRELMPPFDVLVNADGETYRYLINNAVIQSRIEIVKKDAETGKIIPAAGIGFKIRDCTTSQYVVQHIHYPTPMDIDTFYTDNTGKLMLPEPLSAGKRYEAIEQCTAYGYVLDSTPVPFTVDGTQTVVTVVKENKPQKGRITIHKTGEVFASVAEADGLYRPIYTEQGLAGAVYIVSTAEDIRTPDGTLRYAKGTVVAEITTGKDGTAITQPLYLGKYQVHEKKAPYGMVLNTTPLFVELTYAGQEISVTDTAVSFYNERQKAEIRISKCLEADELFGIGGDIRAVRFGLFAEETLTATDGSFIPAGGLLETIGFEEDGHAVFTTDVPVDAKLYTQEIATDGRYILSNKKFPVVFDYVGQDTAVVNLLIHDGEPIVNRLRRGVIRGMKIDRETGKTIAGAWFGLFREDETVFTGETALLTAVSGDDGVFTFENVPPETWLIKELQPAEGFMPNGEVYPVTVTADEEIIEITIANDRIPAIGTTATVGDKKQTHPGETITIKDIVSYQHLIPGREYALKGVLMDKFTCEPFFLNGKEVRSEISFVPETPSGKVVVPFTFDGSDITENTTLVVFESLYMDGTELAIHADIEDEGQTVTVLAPEIGTTATVDGAKEIGATEVFTLADIVSYQHLIPGKEYTLSGVLMNKTTGKPLVIDGEEIRSETVFTPNEPDGEVIVTFIFDSKYIKADTEIVVFERLYCDGRELAVHADIEDAGQTVTVIVPGIGTTAAIEDKQEVNATEIFTLKDIVAYHNLTPGKEYVIKGVLMDKSTGKPLLIDDEEIRSEVKFVPETAHGEVIVPFVFDSRFIKEETDVVAYETLYRENIKIAAHTDIEDKGQTVSVFIPEIGTQASMEGNKESTVTDQITIEDIVSYKNLTPGKEYTVKGMLMDKSTGKALLIDGGEIRSETTFIPETADGEITLAFTFEGKYLNKTTEIVVFETLYREDVPIAVHSDLDDQGQTVTVQIPPPPDIPQTGDTSHIGLYPALTAASGAAIILLSVRRRRYSK